MQKAENLNKEAQAEEMRKQILHQINESKPKNKDIYTQTVQVKTKDIGTMREVTEEEQRLIKAKEDMLA